MNTNNALPNKKLDLGFHTVSGGGLSGYVKTDGLCVYAMYGFGPMKKVAEFSSDLTSVKIDNFWMNDDNVKDFLEELLAEINFQGNREYIWLWT